jgi:hypothetical protein
VIAGLQRQHVTRRRARSVQVSVRPWPPSLPLLAARLGETAHTAGTRRGSVPQVAATPQGPPSRREPRPIGLRTPARCRMLRSCPTPACRHPLREECHRPPPAPGCATPIDIRLGGSRLRSTFRKESGHHPSFDFSRPVELQQMPLVRDAESHDHRVFICHEAIPLIWRERRFLSASSDPTLATDARRHHSSTASVSRNLPTLAHDIRQGLGFRSGCG